MAQQVYEGTWEDVARHASEFKGRRVRLTVVNEGVRLNVAAGGRQERHMYFGMFKGAPDTTEEDFKLAEWHEDIDI